MKEYLVTIYYGVRPQRVSFTRIIKAIRYALNNTPKGDVWQLEILRGGERKYITRTYHGLKR